MKKLLSILLLGSFAIAQAGFTDYLQSGWNQAKSAAPAAIGAGMGASLVLGAGSYDKAALATLITLVSMGTVLGAAISKTANIIKTDNNQPIVFGLDKSCLSMIGLGTLAAACIAFFPQISGQK